MSASNQTFRALPARRISRNLEPAQTVYVPIRAGLEVSERGKMVRSMKSKYFLTICCSILMIAGCSSSNRPKQEASQANPDASTDGTVSIDARISAGSRFTVYCNDVWTSPQTLPLVTGDWHTYQFRVPLALKSLRFDPSESAGADVEIRSVEFDYPGKPPRWMPLADLPKWLQYHSTTTLDPSGHGVRIHTSDRYMYVMSTVDVNNYLTEPPK